MKKSIANNPKIYQPSVITGVLNYYQEDKN